MPQLRGHGEDRARHRRRLIGRILITGLAGAVASALAAAAASRIQNGHAARPMNAIAHIYDDGPPPAHDGANGRNTALGFSIHTAASIWWAVFQEAALALQRRPRPLATASALAALAYVVDYYVVAKRFRPGFEEYLCAPGMFAVYAGLAAGFAWSGRNRRTRVHEGQHQRERAALARRAREAQLTAQKPRQLAADR
jgi:hypothetical protein